MLYNYQSLSSFLEDIGFKAIPLAYFDENGKFHQQSWRTEDGIIRRSAEHDPRNQGGERVYTSLIIDAQKPVSYTHLILYNLFLTPEQLGLYASTLLTFPLIYMSFALLGVPSVAVRFHSRFQDEASRRQLFTFMLVTPFVGLSVFVLLYLLFKPLYLDFYLEHSPLLVRYYYVFIPLTVAMVYLLALEAYSLSLIHI